MTQKITRVITVTPVNVKTYNEADEVANMTVDVPGDVNEKTIKEAIGRATNGECSLLKVIERKEPITVKCEMLLSQFYEMSIKNKVEE